MKLETKRPLILALVIALTGLFATACAFDPRDEMVIGDDLTVIRVAPMGGEALMQRKDELERALADMVVFRQTLESMNDRGDSRGIDSSREFLNNYMALHLEPLLQPRWQSSHPELILVDANLRFVQAELLVQMGYGFGGWTDDVIDELVRRYKQRGNILVDYPIGTQTTLREALRILRNHRVRS
jgi:hypothetical protein